MQFPWLASTAIALFGLVLFMQTRARSVRRKADYWAQRREMFRYLSTLED